mmetsp:Transcript_857/g.2028  ORF Transcript_857/g.2028 Transcript_857/m.2028 type:complete len:224 (+) Transcript_857:981-1652(+)
MVSLECSLSCSSSGCRAFWASTMSRHLGESPAMLPSAHTACSRTSSLGERSSVTKMGTAPLSITTPVFSLVPEAMLVSAHAASNCSWGKSSRLRNSTKYGTTPALITSSMGGERSMDSSLRNCVVASSWMRGSSVLTPSTIWGRLSSLARTLPPAFAIEVESPWGGMPSLRFFRNASSRLSLRIWIMPSSRLRRASSGSMDFLKLFLRASVRELGRSILVAAV